MQHATTGSIMALAVLLAALTGCSQQTAEEKGAALATEKIDLVKGVGSALEEKGAQAAESLTSGLGKVVQGVEKGIEKSGRALVVEPGVAQAGLQITKIQNLTPGSDGNHGLEAYVVSNRACDGMLQVKVFDAMDREIGRSQVALQKTADEAGYTAIPLDARVPLAAITKVMVNFQQKPAT
jgi:hypothetical protein